MTAEMANLNAALRAERTSDSDIQTSLSALQLAAERAAADALAVRRELAAVRAEHEHELSQLVRCPLMQLLLVLGLTVALSVIARKSHVT